MSWWCSTLDPYLTIHHSNIGLHSKLASKLGLLYIGNVGTIVEQRVFWKLGGTNLVDVLGDWMSSHDNNESKKPTNQPHSGGLLECEGL